jgi:hypothetical protein
MKHTLLFIALALGGCGGERAAAQSRTAADVWHIGHALEQGAPLPTQSQVLMGQTLKSAALAWLQDLGYQLDKTGR